MNMLKYIMKIKTNFYYIKQDFYSFRNIVLAFYDSFSSRINLDTLLKIHKGCNEFLLNYKNTEQYYSDEGNENMKKFKKLLKANGKVIYNFIIGDFEDYIKNIKMTCDVILNTYDTEEVEKLVRSIAYKIYNIMFDKEKPCLYDVRSPFAFLTNIIGKEQVDNLTDIIEEFKEKYGDGAEEKSVIKSQLKKELRDNNDIKSAKNLILNIYDIINQAMNTGNYNTAIVLSINSIIKNLNRHINDEEFYTS